LILKTDSRESLYIKLINSLCLLYIYIRSRGEQNYRTVSLALVAIAHLCVLIVPIPLLLHTTRETSLASFLAGLFEKPFRLFPLIFVPINGEDSPQGFRAPTQESLRRGSPPMEIRRHSRQKPPPPLPHGRRSRQARRSSTD